MSRGSEITPTRRLASSMATIIMTSVRQLGMSGRRSLPSSRMFFVRSSGIGSGVAVGPGVDVAVGAGVGDGATVAAGAAGASAAAALSPATTTATTGPDAAVSSDAGPHPAMPSSRPANTNIGSIRDKCRRK